MPTTCARNSGLTGSRKTRRSATTKSRTACPACCPRTPVGCLAAEVGTDVVFPFQPENDLLCRLLRAELPSVDDELSVRGGLIRVADAGELLEHTGPRLGIEALAVSLLADLQRRRDVNEDEAAIGLDERSDVLTGGLVRRDRGTDGDAPVLRDLRCDPADAPDVDVPVLLGEAQLTGEVLADEITVEHGDRAAAQLQQFDHQYVGDGGLARTGEPGEEDREALPGPGLV